MGNKENICSCIDWKNADAGDISEHLLWRNEFHRLELDYEALTQGATIRLCELGVCTVCGGRICIGTRLQAKEDRGETLADILRAASKRWQCHIGKSASAEEFGKLFAELFQESDRADALAAWKAWTQRAN